MLIQRTNPKVTGKRTPRFRSLAFSPQTAWEKKAKRRASEKAKAAGEQGGGRARRKGERAKRRRPPGSRGVGGQGERFDQFDMGMSLPDGYFFGSVPAVIDVALCLPFHSLVDGVDFFQACNSFEQLTEVVLPQFLSFFYMSHFASVLHNSPALFKDFMQITIYSNTPLPVEIPDGYNIESVWGAGAMHSLYWPDILRHRQSRDKQIQKIGNRLVQITF